MGRPKKKHAGGRPPKYSKAKEIFDIAQDYFEKCDKDKTIPNKAGLCLDLNLSRESYREYKAKEEFVDTLKRIEFAIENAWLQRLAGNAPTGAIFYLKNAFKEEYKDKHETDLTSGGQKIKSIIYLPAKPNGGMETK